MTDEYTSDNSASASEGENVRRRPYIGVYFECCGVYSRIYRQPDSKMYVGRCPRCLRQVQARVGPEGVNARIFRAR